MVHDLFNDVSISVSMASNRRITSIRAGTIWIDAVMVKFLGRMRSTLIAPVRDSIFRRRDLNPRRQIHKT
jgi:hypothetical protein